jgi:hypothetical protein
MRTAPDCTLGGMPAVTTWAPRSAFLIAVPTVRSIATYCFAFARPHQYCFRLGSFQICQDRIGSFGKPGRSAHSVPFGP